MLKIEGAALSAGNKDLLVDASLHLRPAERVGLVGRNGAGKTTLIRALIEDGFEGAKVQRRRNVQLGYLPQHAVAGSEASVWDEVASGMVRLVALAQRLEQCQQAVEARQDGGIAALADAEAAFSLAGGYARDERVGTVLHGLGFGVETWTQPCASLSGGWQMRVALAKLLLAEPDVAFLDEPTNHLDLRARSWLAEHLRQVPWTVVVVSHDRHLLDRVATRIVEVRNQRLYSWTGNFTSFLAARDLAREQAESAKEKQDEEIAHLQSFVDRFGAKATKAKQAQSRAKRIDKIDRIELDPPPPLPRIKLPEPPASAQRMLRLVDASIGWDRPLIEGLELEIDRGMRIAVLGENGSGKSTLLKTLSGQLPPLAGRRVPGDRLRLGMFHQEVMADLDPEATPVEAIVQVAPNLDTPRVRAILGALGLPGEAALRPIQALSGGERARVALARLVARPHNLLLLDEPTNHLDAETVEVLVRALREWTGAMLLVSHDRYVVEQLATHVLDAHTGELKEGLDPADFEPKRAESGPAPVKKTDHADRKKQQRERERAARRLEELPTELERAEAAVAAIDDRLVEAANDWSKATALGVERERASAVVDGLFAEWERLETLLAEA